NADSISSSAGDSARGSFPTRRSSDLPLVSQQGDLKKQAALRAVTLVASGMTVGLGTGSTATHFVAELGRRLAAGELARVVGVPRSEEHTSELQSRENLVCHLLLEKKK